nr:retrovirus-related Pol polyprotein from transposon TNT 1-94 [Tanacetum cinerariifolium]
MDSGGSYHMTPRRDFLFDLKEFINRACAILGTGKVRVQMKDGSSFVRENLRYIPELKRNLIFLGTLNQEAYIMKLKNRRVKAESGKASVGIQEKRVLHRVSFGRGQHTTEGVVDYIHADLRGPSRVESMSGSRSSGDGSISNQYVSIYSIGEKDTYGCMVRTSGELRDVKDIWLDDVKTKISISKDVVFNEGLMYMDTLKGAGTADSRKDVEFEVELQGSRVEPTMDPHSRENLKNKEEEQDEGPQ